jgi:hypothetical protein
MQCSNFGKVLNLPNLKSNWITGNSPCFHRPLTWSLLLLRAGTSNEHMSVVLGTAATKLGGNCRMTPKVHPEIALVGIEYDWGYAKLKCWKEINDGIAVHLEENVKKALSPESTLTISRTRKFAR